MKLTMPQIIMMNHAAWVNRENSDRRYNAKRHKDDINDPVIKQEEEKINGMTPAELSMYLASPFE
jgi:hypothetical protein